jgi:SAM-dependent methyltransferase
MKENKYHWYDGWFYDKILAPNQKILFGQIIDLIEPGKSIIDIGCGTGYFDFLVAHKCESTLGIDISERNINRATYNLKNNPSNKIQFSHSTIQYIKQLKVKKFDYAILTYVIHEVNENERIELLKDIISISNYIIIGDFLVPHPNLFDKISTNTVEFLAGKEHYRNFRNYYKKGGISYLSTRSGLKIIKEIKNQPLGTHIALLIQ